MMVVNVTQKYKRKEIYLAFKIINQTFLLVLFRVFQQIQTSDDGESQNFQIEIIFYVSFQS